MCPTAWRPAPVVARRRCRNTRPPERGSCDGGTANGGQWRQTGDVRIPIACTLTADDQPGRLDEWRSFFATQVAAVELPAPDRARLRLADGSAAVLAAAALAQREKQCCGFFEFAIELGAQGRWLSVGVPAEAAPVLADLVDLLPARLRPGTGGR